MIKFKGTFLGSSTAVGAASILAAAGGYLAHADAPGAVNAPQRMAGRRRPGASPISSLTG